MMKKQLLCLAVMAALSHPAHAVIDGSEDPNTSSSPFAGVGALLFNGGTYSGVLIGGQYVLTAAHVASGIASNPGGASFRLNSGAPSFYGIDQVFVYDGFTGTTAGHDGVWHDDLAIIRLAQPVSNAPFYDLYDGSLYKSGLLGGSGATLSFVGYGASGDGTNGVTRGADSGVKRKGRNVVDKIYADDDGGGFPDVFQYTFDKNGLSDEAHLAGGDSGAPAFFNDNGTWKIAGILTFVGAPQGHELDTYGAFGGGTIVAPYIDWINSVMYPVPEAETWAMMLAGLGLVGFMGRRRRQRAV